MASDHGTEMIEIGNTIVPIVSNVNDDEQADVEEFANLSSTSTDVDNTAVQHEPSVKTIRFDGFLNAEVHPNGLSLAEQKEAVKSLRKNDVTENGFQYRDYRGHLMVESVDLTDNSDSRIVHEVSIEGRYFPYPKFYPESDV